MATASIPARFLLIAAFLLAPACRFSAPPAITPVTEPPTAPSPTPIAPPQASSAASEELPPILTPSGPTATTGPDQETGFFGLAVPPDWFHIRVTNDEIEAVAFTPFDPDALAAFEDPEFMVPPDFAIGALARSSLPAGADPDALLAGMEASLASFSDADLASLLTGADRTGLIDLAALETITVTNAETASLGGRPAIAVRGNADFGPDTQPALQVLVLLAWTDHSFFTFYGIAADAAWEEMEPVFLEIVDTVEIP